MDISLSMPPDSMIRSTGFGNVGYYVTRTLQALGHKVPFRDPAAPVELNWAHPTNWEWSSKDQYKIGYAPWESNVIPKDWIAPMRAADEVWTPSPLVARWFEDATNRSVKVYEHGIDMDLWKLRKRKQGDKIKFLHIGEPAPRKGGQLALDAFRDAFGDSKAVSLTIKAYHYNTIRGPGGSHPDRYSNVLLDRRDVGDTELVDIVRNHDVLVYPGYGEGFGLIALQAMATGMPVICTSAWAPYKKFILPDLRLSSKVIDSPWPEMHPGKVFEPDRDQLVEMYRSIAADFDNISDKAYLTADIVRKTYDWKKLTADAFDPIVKKFDNKL